MTKKRVVQEDNREKKLYLGCRYSYGAAAMADLVSESLNSQGKGIIVFPSLTNQPMKPRPFAATN